ncbi:hypothetical protein CsSME_00027099 [Camellia sinensis var. sinensis]
MYKELPLALVTQISGGDSESVSEDEEYKAATPSSEVVFSILMFFMFIFGWILDFSVVGKLFTKFA